MYCFIRGRDPRVWPLRALWICLLRTARCSRLNMAIKTERFVLPEMQPREEPLLKNSLFLWCNVVMCETAKAVLAPVQAFTYREKHISPGSRNAIEGAIYGMWLWTGYMVYMLIWLGYDCLPQRSCCFSLRWPLSKKNVCVRACACVRVCCVCVFKNSLHYKCTHIWLELTFVNYLPFYFSRGSIY